MHSTHIWGRGGGVVGKKASGSWEIASLEEIRKQGRWEVEDQKTNSSPVTKKKAECGGGGALNNKENKKTAPAINSALWYPGPRRTKCIDGSRKWKFYSMPRFFFFLKYDWGGKWAKKFTYKES